jgi:hypothetical protein
MDATHFLSRLLLRGRIQLDREQSSGRVSVEFISADGGQKLSATDDELGIAVFRLYELVERTQPKTSSVWSRKPAER